MSKNSSEQAYENISNVIHQAVLNPHLNKELCVQICDGSKHGLRILSNFRRVKISKAFREGSIEFQDLNSQKVLEDCKLSELRFR